MNWINMFARFILLFLVSVARFHAASLEEYVNRIAPLADPENRSEPGPQRLQKIIYWVAVAKQGNLDVTNILDLALRRVMTNQWAGKPEVMRIPQSDGKRRGNHGPEKVVTNEAPVRQFTLECLLRNLNIAELKGCLDAAGLERMRRGEPAIPPREAQEGNPLIAKEFVPAALCPQLAGFMANFHLTVHRKTEAHITRHSARGRKVIFADKFLELGVLSQECYDKFMAQLPEVGRP